MNNHWMFLTEVNIALKCFNKTSFRTRWSAVISWPHFTLQILVSVLISLISTTITLARYIVIKRQVPLVLPIPVHLSSPPVFSGVRVTRSLVLWVCFVDRCLSFFSWPLRCLFFFELRILITPLVSSCNKMSLYYFPVTNSEYFWYIKFGTEHKWHGISHIPKNRSQMCNMICFYCGKLCNMKKNTVLFETYLFYIILQVISLLIYYSEYI
jgi:hypothetical protein